MKLILAVILFVVSAPVFAINCDCEVRVYGPTTASHQIAPNSMKVYELEEFSSYSVKNQNACRNSCLSEFEKDMNAERLNALLLLYTQNLIQEKVLGYNCTGLTTVKYPVRVKASLGRVGLGNVADFMQVITYEEPCF